MPAPHHPPQRPGSPDVTIGVLPWGCRIPLEPYSRWPLRTVVAHDVSSCRCKRKNQADKDKAGQYTSKGGDGDRDDAEVVRHFLFWVAHEYYYKVDPEKYTALACHEMIKRQAERLGLELGGKRIWDIYGDCAVRE
ncbi:hypothetical protein F5B22DRAFT_115158 [Xylaria bambusicola]|uniref:uncharacterized protein n=1 Tax=Xylaria bambusicola TaxID=326684 RepID=UPI0020079C63|nr:uncharacterized protein F5B22DRAFT_115158 [Xylaria bambusicola]KAI0517256.1 hypothetical protein F5B22DRAFT_115158 [Xylaria bambusicola]